MKTPPHGLEQLDLRDGPKPIALLSGGQIGDCERTIFRDEETGAEIWKMTHDPATSRHIYYDIPAWNADGSLLFFLSFRKGGLAESWVMNADGTGVRELDFGRGVRANRPIWSATDPDALFYAVGGEKATEFWQLNVRTGKRKKLAEADIVHNVEMCPPSSDGRYLLTRGLRDPKVKEWTVYLVDLQTGERQPVPIEGNIHRLRFTRAPDHSIFFNLNDPVYEVRLGSYVCDREGGNLVELPVGRAGHPDWSPDGSTLSATTEGGIWLIDRDGANKRQLVDMASGMHGGWSSDSQWIVADAPENGRFVNLLLRVHAEERGRVHVLCRHFASYQGWTAWHPDAESTHPAPVSSPDDTKIVFDSDMIGGWGEVYVLPVRLPDPPRNLQAKKSSGGVELTWEAPERCRETAGYVVYRSGRSGVDFAPVARVDAKTRKFADKGKGRGPRFYRVVAVEHSGLEGRSSDEIRVGGKADELLRLHVDPALGERRGLVDAYDGKAAHLHCVRLKEGEKGGAASVQVALPRPGEFCFWMRLRGQGAFSLEADGLELGRALGGDADWRWVRVLDAAGRPAKADLAEGGRNFTVGTSDPGVRLDRVLVTDDHLLLPDAPGEWATEPPPPVPEASVLPASCTALEVVWTPPAGGDVRFYNVYSDTKPDFECGPRTLIASPVEPRWVDWGLCHGMRPWRSTTYYYRITAVGPCGAESEPSEVAQGRTGIPGRRANIPKLGARKR